MKLLSVSIIIYLLLISIVNSANIDERQENNIEKLLEQLENANNNNVNNNNNKVPESVSVRDALTQLLTAFQQMASAYVGVLTSLGRSIGIRGTQYLDSPVVIKQLEENIQLIQESFQETIRSINGWFTREGPQNGNVFLNQFRKFIELWQKEIQEVTGQVTRAFGGLEARQESNPPPSSITLPLPLFDLFQQFVRIFQDTFTALTARVNRLISGDSVDNLTAGPRQEPDSSQWIILREIRQILQTFQRQMASLTLQLNRALIGGPNLLEAGDENKDGQSYVPQLIGLQQFQQIFDTFQKSLAAIINRFSRIFTGQVELP
jgi:hypothetical protein